MIWVDCKASLSLEGNQLRFLHIRLEASCAVWTSLVMSSGFWWTFWVAHPATGRKLVHTWTVGAISLKFMSSRPTSACRGLGKGWFLFLVILGQKGRRQSEMLVWRVAARCLRKLRESRIQSRLQMWSTKPLQNTGLESDLLNVRVFHGNVIFLSTATPISINDNHSKTDLFAE